MLELLGRRFVVSLALATANVLAHAASASACSPSDCEAATALPTADTVPADAGGVFVYPGRRYLWTFEDFALELRLVEAGTAPVVLPVTWSDPPAVGAQFRAMRVDATLPVGAQLELWGRDGCAEFDLGAELPEPIRLRSWTIVAPLGAPNALGTVPPASLDERAVEVPTGAGSCSVDHETTVADVTLALDPSAEPWAEVFLYETLVDGAPYFERTSITWFGGPTGPQPGGSSYGRGVDVVYTRCGDVAEGVAPGEHSIAFRASLPDGRTFTSSATTLVFTCDLPSSGRCSFVAGSAARLDPASVALAAGALVALVRRRRRVARSPRAS